MKKILSLLLSFTIIFSSVSAVSALDIRLPQSLESFTDDVSTLINDYEESVASEEPVFFAAEDDSETIESQDTNRLIVKSSDSIDTLNSIGYVGGYNDLHILQFADDADCDAAFEYYSSLDNVEYVQEDCVITESSVEESEATFEEAAIGTASQYQSDFFGYSDAKDNMGSSEVVIAVVDSGVANDHDFLKGRVIPTGFDSINNESCYDDRGHGTHVAGIIVANTKSNVKVKPYKVLDSTGQGTDTQVYLGIQAAIEDGVDVINLSLTRQGESELMHEAVINAYNAGITVVAAAGNSNANVSEKFYSPASFPEVICAVSISTTRYKADTSNWGSSKDLSAPGVDILSSYLNNTYKILSGTSMAAPFISCCVAYLLSTGTYYSPDSAYSTLYSKTRAGGGTHDIHYVCPGTLVNSKNVCSAPVFTYASGDFAGYLDVKITCETAGATIMYRTSDMSSNVYYEYTTPVRITESTTFTAYAFCRNYKNSASISAGYTKNDTDASMFQIDENDVLIGYTGTETDVTVPGYFNGGCVSKVAASAFSGNTDITSVTFSKYVNTIGEGAFEGCKSLTSVSASGVTDIETEAFKGCSSLKTVSIPAAVTIGNKAFLGCSALTSLTVNKVTTIGDRAFENSGITTLSASKLTTIGDNAFYSTGLKSISSSNITTIGSNAYAYCEDLKSVSLPYATTIGDYAFTGCENLTSFEVPKVTSFSNSVFKNCTALTSIVADSLTEIGDYTFYGCSALNTVNLPALTTVGKYAFAETGFESISLPLVTTLGTKAFGDCSSLKSVYLAGITNFVSDAFNGSVNIETLSLNKATDFDFGDGSLATCFPNLTTFINTNGFTNIPDYLFDGCTKLSSVTLNSNITAVGDCAFRGASLDSINLPDAKTFGVGAFSEMTTLESVTLGAATDIDFSIFSGSSNVKYVKLNCLNDLPDGFRCKDIFPLIETFNCSANGMSVPDYAFKDCSNLSYFNFFNVEEVGCEAFRGTAISNPYFSTVSSVGERAFADCTNLGNVSMATLSDINMNVFENSEHTVTGLNLNYISYSTDEGLAKLDFQKFTNLESIGLDRQTSIPDYAFKNCTKLNEVVISSCKTIGKEAFANCSSLTTIKLPSAKTIESGAFSGCTGLESFTADKVTAFDFDTFKGCSNLKKLSFNSILEFPVDENGKFELSDLENLESFSADAVDVVPSNFLKGCKNLKTVSFYNAGEIGDYAFYGTSLSSFNIPFATIIGDYAFYATDIATITLDNLVTVGEYAFSECDLLADITITSDMTAGEGVFANCDNVDTITLSGVKSLPVNAISGCPAVTYLDLTAVTELPVAEDGSSYVSDKPLLVSFYADCVKNIPDSYFVNNPLLQDASFLEAVTVGEKAFMNTNLSAITSEALEVIGDYAYYGTEISSADIVATEIGDYAFADCQNLTQFVIYTDFSEVTLGKGVCENNTALTRAAIYGENIELPDYFFKNCTKLNRFLANDMWKKTNYADLKTVGEEAFYGCNAMYFEKIKLVDIEQIGKNAFVGVKTASSSSLNLPNLISADEGAFGELTCLSLALENVEVLKDIPACDYVVIGSDIKEFGCESTDSIICAYEDSVVADFCTENELNFKKYDGKENIYCDVDPVITGYEYPLSFEGIGFNLTYKWYACNNPDRSDAVEITTTNELPNVIDPISLFFDDYEENKYKYFYCVATSTENGNVMEIQSALTKNIFATIRGTDDTFIDFWENYIYTNSIDNINTLSNIFTVDGDIEVTPSYSTANENCYGTGTVVKIMNGDEVALTQTIVVYGDVNGDGVVDVLDVSCIEKVSNNADTLDGDYKLAADIDSSNAVDVTDYQAAVNKALAS